MNICAFLDLLELLEVVLSSPSQGNACASLTREQPDVLSWSAFSFFLKQMNHACEVVVKSRRESWEEGIFPSPAVPPLTQIKSWIHQKCLSLPTLRKVLIMTSFKAFNLYFMLLLIAVFDSGDIYICTNDLSFSPWHVFEHIHTVKHPFVFFEVWCWHLETHQELLSSALFLRKALFLFQTSFCAETMKLLCLIMLLLLDDEAFLGKPDLPRSRSMSSFL